MTQKCIRCHKTKDYQLENDKLVLNNKIINPYFIQNP